MTPDALAASYLAGEIQPLQAALKILGAYSPITEHPVWEATGGAHGPLSGLYAAADEVDRIGYIGADPEWWHPNVRTAKAADLAETQQRMQPRIQAACEAIIKHDRARTG